MDECLSHFNSVFGLQKNSNYTSMISDVISRFTEAGIIAKFKHDELHRYDNANRRMAVGNANGTRDGDKGGGGFAPLTLDQVDYFMHTYVCAELST